MFFIYGTDAPLYHYPIVTSLMVIINVVVHWAVAATGFDVTPWVLAFGDGYHPLQWITHNYLHMGLFHLIGNMLFLFPFGMVVEGKIGPLKMLVLYLAIGGIQGFTQQTMMLPYDTGGDAEAMVEMFNDPDNPMDDDVKAELKKQWRKDLMQEGFGSLGASAVIFGLLAVCVMWAPSNHFDVYFRWSLFVSASDGGVREWAISTVCAMFVAKEVFMFWLMGMPLSSEMLHLNGFLVGGFCGFALLTQGWVDCEGYDLLSIWGGRPYKAKAVARREQQERADHLDSLRPTGPPLAVIPKMPHQLSVQPMKTVAREPATQSPLAPPASVSSNESTPQAFQKNVIADQSNLFELDLELPEFDDGSVLVDPIAQVRSEIDGMMLEKAYVAAVRLFASERKLDPSFIILPSSLGRLAEGLIAGQQIKPARTLLAIGSDAYPAHAPQWRIRIASLYLSSDPADPIAAIKQLKQIDKSNLDSKTREQFLKIANRAKRLAEQSN